MNENISVIDDGHEYEVVKYSSLGKRTVDYQKIRFIKDERIHGNGYSGSTCQDLIRIIIDRVKFLDNELHWNGNNEIIKHLRLALILFEQRHLERLVEKNEEVEYLQTFMNGHMVNNPRK